MKKHETEKQQHIEIQGLQEIETALQRTPQLASRLRASIHIDNSGLSLLAQAPQPTKEGFVAGFHHYSFRTAPWTIALKEVFFDNELLAMPFASTHIYSSLYTHNTGGFALIPTDLSKVATAEEWLASAIKSYDTQAFCVTVPDVGGEVCFGFDKECYEFCQRSFSLPHFTHRAVPLLSLAVGHTRRLGTRSLFARVDEERLDLVYADNGTLQLGNSYEITDAVDILYYITAIWRQSALLPETDSLYIYARSSTTLQQVVDSMQSTLAHIHINDYFDSVILPHEVVNNIPSELLLQHFVV